MKVVICGGHLTPAIATIEVLKKKGIKVVFFGRRYSTEGDPNLSQESKTIQSLGIPFYPIAAGRLQRKFTKYTIPSLLRVPAGIVQSFYFLLTIKPDVICSFGSYVAFPTVFSGWLLHIPIITHEQTVGRGLASRVISFFSQKIAISWEESKKYFNLQKTVLVGNPIRKEIFETNPKDPELKKFLNKKNQQLIYFTGGNQGSHILNESIFGSLDVLLEKYRVFVQTGPSKNFNDFDKFINYKLKILPKLSENFIVREYVDKDDIGAILNYSDLVVSRAGANIIWEVGALGKVAIFVPIPWAQNDEQTQNAKILVDMKVAEILPQNDLTSKNLIDKIEKVFANYKDYEKYTFSSQKKFDRNASEKLVAEIIKLGNRN